MTIAAQQEELPGKNNVAHQDRNSCSLDQKIPTQAASG